MTSSKAGRSAALVALSLALAAPALAAQPTAEDYATARALYKQGKELRAAGDLPGALEKLKAAHALGRTPITGIELARTQEQLHLLVEARETCLEILRMPVASDESDRSAAARTEAKQLADAIRPRLGAIRIRVASSAPAMVAVDGASVPAAALGEPRLVNPGRHVVTAHVEGGSAVSESIDVAESQTGDVSLAPPPAPIVHTTMQVTPPSEPVPATPTHHGIGVLAVTGIVIGGVGLAIGAASGLVAWIDSTGLQATCANHECPQSAWSTLDSAQAAALVSTVGFGVAGAGAVLLVVGLLTRSSQSASARGPRILPEIGLGQFGVRGAF